MHTTSLRKVGGSVMMVVPPVLLETLNLRAGMVVGLETDGERLVIQPQLRSAATVGPSCAGRTQAGECSGGSD